MLSVRLFSESVAPMWLTVGLS